LNKETNDLNNTHHKQNYFNMTPEINLKKLEAARLYHFTEMDKHEISELLDIPPGAVQSAAVAFKFDMREL
jgi:hypothetical protein